MGHPRRGRDTSEGYKHIQAWIVKKGSLPRAKSGTVKAQGALTRKEKKKTRPSRIETIIDDAVDVRIKEAATARGRSSGTRWLAATSREVRVSRQNQRQWHYRDVKAPISYANLARGGPYNSIGKKNKVSNLI